MVLDALQVQNDYIWRENTFSITTVRPRKLNCTTIPCSLPIIWKIVHLDFHAANGRKEMCQFYTRRMLYTNLDLSWGLPPFELVVLLATFGVAFFSVIVGKLLEISAGVVEGLSLVVVISKSLCFGEVLSRLSCDTDTLILEPSEVSKGAHFLGLLAVLDCVESFSFTMGGCDTK